MGHDGSVESEIPLPGQQQEGIAVDPAGNLWVADDQDKSLLKMDAAVPAMEKFLRDPAAFTPLG
jgi:streptogramin lyase